jgi:hypothetical protein
MEGSLASTVGGANNPRWLAPELLDGQQATPAADVFAFGVVMWEVLTWDIPWGTEQAFVVSGRSARWIKICFSLILFSSYCLSNNNTNSYKNINCCN